MNPADADRPRKIQDKEVAAAIGVHPHTLTRWKHDCGLRLPRWPRTMSDCIAAVRAWRDTAPPPPCVVSRADAS